jgi:hypothetical protein
MLRTRLAGTPPGRPWRSTSNETELASWSMIWRQRIAVAAQAQHRLHGAAALLTSVVISAAVT